MYNIRVFCKNISKNFVEEVLSFIDEGVFFDKDAKVLASDNEIQVQYNSLKEPIRISVYDKEADYSRKQIGDILFILSKSKESSKRTFLESFLPQVNSTIRIQFTRAELNDDTWLFLDSLEKHFAFTYDGIIHTDDEDFFDKNLKKIYRL